MPTQQLFLKLKNNITNESHNISISPSFTDSDIQQYLRSFHNTEKLYQIEMQKIPFINSAEYMINELALCDEDAISVEYEEINYAEPDEVIEEEEEIGFMIYNNEKLYFGNKKLIVMDRNKNKCVLYKGFVDKIDVNDEFIILVDKQNNILRVFDEEIKNNENEINGNCDENKGNNKEKKDIDNINGNNNDNKEKVIIENEESKISIIEKIIDEKKPFENEEFKISSIENNIFEKDLNSIENVFKKSDSKITSIKLNDNFLFYSTTNGKIFKYNLIERNEEMIAQDQSEIMQMEIYNDFLFVASLTNSFYLIDLKSDIKKQIVKNFPVPSFMRHEHIFYLCGTNGSNKIVNEDLDVVTVKADERYINFVFCNDKYKIFASQNIIYIHEDLDYKKKLLFEECVRSILIIEDNLYVACDNKIKIFYLPKNVNN
ncbi:hypothetical protein GVAV_000981 [Gurleya vavrai]